MENELKELNFNSLLILDENIGRYNFLKYLENGGEHKIKGFCTFCEENGLNICLKDYTFSLKNISHGAMSDDLFLATGQQDMDFTNWKDEPVMFVMENPSRDWGFYKKQKYNGFIKKPTKEWYWIHEERENMEFPEAFKGKKYGRLFNSIIFTFKLRNAYLTNFVKCGMNREKNEYKPIEDYQPLCIEHCYERYLSKEIEIFNPKVIFCFGNKVFDMMKNIRRRKILKSKFKIMLLPHPARQRAGFKDVFYRHLYYTRILQGLWIAEIYNTEEAGDKFKDFLNNYSKKI